MKIFYFTVLFLMPVLFSHAQKENQNLSENQKRKIIEKALELIKENYVFPDKYDRIEREINVMFFRGEFNSNKPQEFLNQLNKNLQTAGEDRHFKISFNPQLIKQINDERKNGSVNSPNHTPELLQWLKFENYGLKKVERMEGNIGYFRFDRFADLQLAKESITGAMNFLGNSSAIILDLRENGGGDSKASELILNYFFPDGKKIGEVKFRKETQPKESIVEHDSLVKKIPDSVPLYILVGGKTASAAEAVAYVLQKFKRAVVVGEQTSGKANPGELFVVTDSLYMMVPTGLFKVLPTGTNWEGTGVKPDIVIDPLHALPKAIIEICSILEKEDGNEEHKFLYRWINEQYSAALNPEIPSQEFINGIIGNYESNRKIIYENGTLYFVGNTGTKRKLSYMNNRTFMTEGRTDYRLKFSGDGKPVEYYEVLWFDGTSEKVKKLN